MVVSRESPVRSAATWALAAALCLVAAAYLGSSAFRAGLEGFRYIGYACLSCVVIGPLAAYSALFETFRRVTFDDDGVTEAARVGRWLLPPERHFAWEEVRRAVAKVRGSEIVGLRIERYDGRQLGLGYWDTGLCEAVAHVASHVPRDSWSKGMEAAIDRGLAGAV